MFSGSLFLDYFSGARWFTDTVGTCQRYDKWAIAVTGAETDDTGLDYISSWDNNPPDRDYEGVTGIYFHQQQQNDYTYNVELELIDPTLITTLFDYDAAIVDIDPIKTIRAVAVSGTVTKEFEGLGLDYVENRDPVTLDAVYTNTPARSSYTLHTETYALVGDKVRATCVTLIELYNRVDTDDGMGGITHTWTLLSSTTTTHVFDINYYWDAGDIKYNTTTISNDGDLFMVGEYLGLNLIDGALAPVITDETELYNVQFNYLRTPINDPLRIRTAESTNLRTLSRLYPNSVQARHNDLTYLTPLEIAGDANTITGGAPTKHADLAMTVETVDGVHKFSEIDTLAYQDESCLSFTNVIAAGDTLTPTVTRVD